MEQITSRKNPLAVHLKKLGAVREYRAQRREFLCDGVKLLREAIDSGASITAVLSATDALPELPGGVPVYFAAQDILDAVSPLKNAQDVLFSCKMQDGAVQPDMTGSHILLDGIQDPGNAGTIIRTAVAFGIKSVILTEGCADVYNPKTVRASMGAIFKQRVAVMTLRDVAGMKQSGVRLLGAALGDGCRSILDSDIKNAVIAIGSEGSGLSAEILALCDALITIPMAPECESLNAAVAAAIIMWELGGHSAAL